MEMPKNLALCLVCNKDLGPLNQIPTFYHRPNVLFSRTPATSTLLRHKLESIVKDIVVFRSETCCLCVKCAGLINLADALEAELQSVCRQLSDHYWRTARLRGFGEERAIVCITPLPPKPVTSAADGGGGGAGGVGQRRSGPPPPPPLQQQPQQQPPPPPPPLQQMIQHQQQMQQMQQHGAPGQMMMPGWPMHPMAMAQAGQAPMGWQPGMAGVAPDAMPGPRPPAYPGMPAAGAGEMADPEPEPGRELERSMSQESDDATGVCQLLSAVEVELTEVKQEPGEDADTSNHLMREPVDIEVDPWRDLGYEDANAMEKLASKKTRSMPPPSAQSAPVRWPHQPHPPGGGGGHGHGGHGGRQTAVARTTRTYGTGAGPRPEAPRAPGAERPAPPPNLPPGAQKTHQRIMKTLTSHSSAIQQAVANGVLSLEVRPPGSAAPPPPPMTRKLSGGSGGKAAGTTSRPLPPLAPALPPKTPAGMDPAQAQATAVAQLASLSSGTNFKIKLPSLTPRDGAASPAAVASPSGAGRPATPPNEQESPTTDGAASASPPTEFPGKTIAWFHKSQRLRPGNYTYVKSGDSLNGKLIPIAPTKGRPPRRRANAGPIVRLVVGTPMNKKRYPPLEKALAMVAAAARGGGHPAGRYRVEPRILPKPDVAGPSAPAASTQPASTSASTSDQVSTSADQAQTPQEETPAEEESEKPETKEDEAAGEGEPADPPPPPTPVKRGRGRPRKDGKSPGSVSVRRGRPPRRQSPAAAEKRPADESQPSAPPPAKRRRLERPPPESNGRRHSRRLSARLSQMEPEAETAEASSPPLPAAEAEATPVEVEPAAEGEGSKDDGSAAADDQVEAPPDDSSADAPADAPDENGSAASPAGDAGAAMDESAPDASADDPDSAPAPEEGEKSPAPTAPSESEDGTPAATDTATEAEHIPESTADP